MNDRERAELVRQAASGDADALQQLIVHYHARLVRVVRREIDEVARRHIDPDDVLQGAYIVAFRTAVTCSFDSPAAFYAWLERIAMNQLRDMQRGLRRQKRDMRRALHDPPEAATSYPDLVARLAAADSTPSRKAVRAESVAAVVSSLARLTDDQRHVVKLRFLEGRSVGEVATRLGKTQAAVHMLCHRGLKTLRELMMSASQYVAHP